MRHNHIIQQLMGMSNNQFQDIANLLVWYAPADAERLRNCLMVAQQERDMEFLEREKQYEMMSRDSDMEYGNA